MVTAIIAAPIFIYVLISIKICDGEMQVAKSVSLHNAVGRLAAFLARVGKASGVDKVDAALLGDGGLVGVAIAYDVHAACDGLL